LALDKDVWDHLWDGIEEVASFEIVSRGCNAAINSCYINPLGEVLPCIDFPVSCGSLRNGGDFGQIWQESLMIGRVRLLQERLKQANELLCLHREQINTWQCDPITLKEKRS
jgi:radical SAM protein with 4Fe4S-binding SPASM domain